MTVPKWQEFMAPVLQVLLDGQTLTRRELYDRTAHSTALSDSDRAEVLNSGQLKYENRIGWATSYLTRVTALDRPGRGRYAITDVGRTLLAEHPGGITERDLRALAGNPDARTTREALMALEPTSGDGVDEATELNPTEQIEQGVARIDALVAADLLDRLRANTPDFFERAVVELLVAMGYGGTAGQGTVTGLSHDGGIDGIIDQDPLGLDRVYVQAKRYAADNSVQRPELQGFVGALSGKADRGVFITTGRFTPGAQAYATSVPTRIILIDGHRLASLMIAYKVGVQVTDTVHIVAVDEDFFE